MPLNLLFIKFIYTPKKSSLFQENLIISLTLHAIIIASGNPARRTEIVEPHSPHHKWTPWIVNSEEGEKGITIHANSQMSIANPPPQDLQFMHTLKC